MVEQADALLTQLSAFLSERLGLHFPPKRHAGLAAAMRSAARELGHADADSCIRSLLASRLSRREVEILASHLTIGETYFFREKEALDALQAHLLPEIWRARARGERRLRVWSAGCCTGEEAYSLAIVVARSLPEWRDWNISILATDINPHFLRKAAEGVYGAWSFRGFPAELREAFFRKAPDGRWKIDASLRSLVTFSYLNLAEDGYPSLENGTNAMDVILCRNVLMYFEPARARAVLEKLGRCLVMGGRLFVNPVEVARLPVPGLEVSKLAGAYGYRKADGMAAPAPSEIAPAPLPRSTDFDWTAPPKAAAPAAQEAGDAAAMAQRAREYANEGRLADALAWCDQALVADKLDSRWHYLRATILLEQGDFEEAAAALARALYLEPRCALAHFALGNLSRGLGREEESRRHFRNALCVLADYGEDELLPESEGLSAGRLAQIIEATASGAAAA